MYLGDVEIRTILSHILDRPSKPEDVFLIFLAEKTKPDLAELVAALKEAHIRFMGGVFPGVIHRKLYREGAVILQVPACKGPMVITDFENVATQCLSPSNHPGSEPRSPLACPTVLVLVDGFAPNISHLLNGLFAALGSSAHYLGGGCGSASLRQEPCLFSAEGVFENAALALTLDLGCSIGIQHGWRRLTGPLAATQTDRNVIRQLNGQKAFDVYRDIVEKDSRRKLSPDQFYAVAKEYPFGIVLDSDEDLVRDPIAVGAEGELICIGDIPENAALNVLKGQKSALVAAAGRAAGYLCKKGPPYRQCLLFDCVSRSLYLDQAYSKELDMIHNSLRMSGPTLVAEGALSIGEIASTDQKEIDFFNKTTVVGGLYDLEKPTAPAS
ncbi:MAG TPA: hypothetical protein DCZ95_06170 [Verrucomicrobia bacterium]|nr:MAG: hypothetical protein A2X46_13280 [Lentisphaerae bacterium GWF2_57_35]HBA83664.1 hypothetical protein [Verrucomicrobiota bacterium]